MNQYDAIIIGGGVNSLIVASLLGKAGQNVILLEAKDKLGGMGSSPEFFPGFRCNIVYDYIPWLDPKLIKELKLHQYGLEFLSADPMKIALSKKGSHINFYKNPKTTASSISQHSSKDAELWPQFTQYIAKLTQFLEPLYKTIPPIISKLNIMDVIHLKNLIKPLRKYGTRGLTDILRTVPMMMPELMDEWFESELLRGSLAAAGIRHITQGPYSAATVLNFLHQHIYSNGIIHNAKYIKGGTEMLIRALEQAAKEKTVDIRLNTQVTSLKCKNGICSGVIAGNHQTFKANKIISGLDPSTTCLNMIDSTEINPTFRRQLSNIKYRGSTARIHFALNTFPKIIGIKKEQMDAVFTISPSIDYLERAFDDTKYGRISKNPFIEFTLPTYLNPHFSPSGKHVLSATIQYVPYHLRNNALNGELKEKIIYHLINILGGYIPDFSNMIEHSALQTPLDFQTSLGLTEGNLNHGEMTLDQFYIMRPTISSAQYKTPIENLFLCGPGTHPGGGLHGTNGLNAVKEIMKT